MTTSLLAPFLVSCMGMIEIVTLAILILSIVFHEISHGYMANWLGDPTARLAGRLNPNPLLHIDLFGSIIVPGLLYVTGSPFLFGWAKPVPYNPYNLNNQKWGEALVAAAGPLSNLFLALLFGFFIRMSGVLHLSASSIEVFGYIVLINVLLACFNALPIPPLDGSKVIMPFLGLRLGEKYRNFLNYMERLGFFALFLLIFVVTQVLWNPFYMLVHLVTNFIIGG